MKLFQLDNFFGIKIKYKESGQDSLFFEIILDKYFDDFKIETINAVDAISINSKNYKIDLRVGEEKRVILFREYNNLRAEQIVFYLSILSELADRGVLVGKPISAKNNDFIVKSGGKNYALFVFLSGEYFSPNFESLLSAARQVAAMHKVFAKLNKDKVDKISKLSEQTYSYFNEVKDYTSDDFIEIKNIIEAKNEINESDKRTLEQIPLFLETVGILKDNREKINRLPKQIIHSDLHPHNFLIMNNKVAGILDFDAMRESQKARDAACAIYRLGRQFFARGIVDNNKESGSKIRDKFINAYSEINPLSEEEKDLMGLLVKDEFIRKILFVLRGIYKKDNFTWSQDLFKFLIAIDEVNYFFN